MFDFLSFFEPYEDDERNKIPLDGFLLSTYNIDFEHLQEDLMPRILSIVDPQLHEEHTNIMVEKRLNNIPSILITDSRELNQSNGNVNKWPKEIAPIFIPQVNVMHLKLWIATFGDVLRIFIGSANLTSKGIGTEKGQTNLECGVWFEIIKGRASDVNAKDIAKMLKHLVYPTVLKTVGKNSKEKHWLFKVIKILNQKPEKEQYILLTSYGDTLYNKVHKKIDLHPSCLRVLSPYFDGSPIEELPFGKLEYTKLELYSSFGLNGEHIYMHPSFLDVLPNETQFFSVTFDSDGMEQHNSLWHRFPHAKIYYTGNWAALGSANFTWAGWRRSIIETSRGGNLECIVLFPKLSKELKNTINSFFKPEVGWYLLPKAPNKEQVSFNENYEDSQLPSGIVYADLEEQSATIYWLGKKVQSAAIIHWKFANIDDTVHCEKNDYCAVIAEKLIESLNYNPPTKVNVSFENISEKLQLFIIHPPASNEDFVSEIPLEFWFSNLKTRNTDKKVTNNEDDTEEKEPNGGLGGNGIYHSIVHHIDAIEYFANKYQRFLPGSIEDAIKIAEKYFEKEKIADSLRRILNCLIEELLCNKIKSKRGLTQKEKKILKKSLELIKLEV